MSECRCPICVTNRSLDTLRVAVENINRASNAWIEFSGDDEGSLYHLRDEIEAAVNMPMWRWSAARKRLRKALEIPQMGGWTEAVNELAPAPPLPPRGERP